MAKFKVEFNSSNGSTNVIVETDKNRTQLMSHFGNKIAECSAIGFTTEVRACIVTTANLDSVMITPLAQAPASVNLRDFTYYTAE